jgi:hypothetical protein
MKRVSAGVLVFVAGAVTATILLWLWTTRWQNQELNTTTPLETASNSNSAKDQTTSTISDNADAHACDEDMMKFCQGTPVGKMNLVNCLLDDHGDEISAACRQSLERRQELNETMVAACQSDRKIFCQGVEPQLGSAPLDECLGEHQNELSPDCAAAYTAHEAVKPTE